MKYLTKEWYNLSQLTDLHFGLRAYKDAAFLKHEVYIRLKKRKEKEFIKLELEIYDLDPRELLENDGKVMVRADKFISGEEILEEDTIVYEMSEEQKDNICKLIEEFNSRSPFNVQKSKEEFEKRQAMILSQNEARLPKEVYSQIADPRVFALGYSTKEIIDQLKRISLENEKKVQSILKDYSKAQEKENIPVDLRERFGFHDCKVSCIEKNQDITIIFDTSGGFTDDNRVVFHDATIIREENAVDGGYWIYEELYKTKNGFEAHMLFADETNLSIELTIACKDITIDKV